MSDHTPDNSLQQMFAQSNQELAGDAFTTEVMSRVDKLKYRVIVRRVLLGLAFALITIPLEDVVLGLTHFLLLTLVELDNSLVADLLAPVNSVASLLSLILLTLRIAHKRLFN